MGRDDGSDSMRMWGSFHKAFRQAAGLTHEDVAQHVGYSVSLVISIERRNFRKTRMTLRKRARHHDKRGDDAF